MAIGFFSADDRQRWTYEPGVHRYACGQSAVLLPEECDEWPDGVVQSYTRRTLPSEWDAAHDVGRDLLYVTHLDAAVESCDCEDVPVSQNEVRSPAIVERDNQAPATRSYLRPLISWEPVEDVRDDPIVEEFARIDWAVVAAEPPTWLYEEWDRVRERNRRRRTYADLFKHQAS